jgi:hypothetical protein
MAAITTYFQTDNAYRTMASTAGQFVVAGVMKGYSGDSCGEDCPKKLYTILLASLGHLLGRNLWDSYVQAKGSLIQSNGKTYLETSAIGGVLGQMVLLWVMGKNMKIKLMSLAGSMGGEAAYGAMYG